MCKIYFSIPFCLVYLRVPFLRPVFTLILRNDIWNNCDCRLGYNVEKLEPLDFHVSQEKARQLALSVSSSWNSVVGIIRSLCKGKDWSLFLRVCYAKSLSQQRLSDLI